MPIRLDLPIIKECILEKSDAAYGDPSQPTRVSIRQATQGDTEKRGSIFAQVIREWSQQNNAVRLIQRYSYEELKRIEVQLTLCGSNIEDEDGKPLFKFDGKGRITDVAAFNIAWNSLPPLVAAEIHEKVMEANPDWNPEVQVSIDEAGNL